MKNITLRSGKFNKKNNQAILRPRLFSVVNGIYKYFNEVKEEIKRPIIEYIKNFMQNVLKIIKKCFKEIKKGKFFSNPSLSATLIKIP